ncbi:hypothetical protein IMZ31_21545 (plasmid) [Pontibacillus sp. ALD_SL1]|uniref:hypothetical protein n=1 Tax=Pontibacillus sp. ALD_SL1 TaxID=2777185 RepID=UPI001A96A7B6|nr:hypothetical protein [Pontibacillus sp. ALD_SL1]QST02037.1 hypothetical protein IMZ31_21545 [Pontibacillus sp. ALD_SL1]
MIYNQTKASRNYFAGNGRPTFRYEITRKAGALVITTSRKAEENMVEFDEIAGMFEQYFTDEHLLQLENLEDGAQVIVTYKESKFVCQKNENELFIQSMWGLNKTRSWMKSMQVVNL